ncbi:MerR family transcriptional regulator [Streptomyces collinus]
MTTTDTEEPTLTIDELAARAGVTVRTVRFYGTKGLLPPPVLGPRRVGHYGREHLARLALIEELQQQGMTLAGIERYLRQLPPDLSAHDLAIHRAVVASWAPESVETVTPAELERRAGRPLGEEDVERLVAMGVVRPADGGYEADLGLLRLGAGLLDVPLSQEAILAARKVLVEHARAAGRGGWPPVRGGGGGPGGPGGRGPGGAPTPRRAPPGPASGVGAPRPPRGPGAVPALPR